MLDAIGLGELVQTVDDFDGQFAVGWVGDVLFLHCGVDVDGVFQCGFAEQSHTALKQLVHAFCTNAFPEIYQFTAVARQLAAKLCESAKGLVVRVALELQHHCFVTKAFQLLEDQQSHHQPYGLGRPSQSLAIMLGEGPIQLRPRNHAGKAEQRIIGIELLQQVSAE